MWYLRALSGSFVFALCLSAVLPYNAATVLAQSTCPGANPYDAEPDNLELQQCLDGGGIVALEPTSYPNKYIISDTIVIRVNNTHLTSTGPGKAKLQAHPSLNGPIIRSESFLTAYEISEINVDGNKLLRDLRNQCFGFRDYGTNLDLSGSGYRVHHIESVAAMCGTALGVGGSNFEIDNNLVAYNGRDKNSGVPGEPWSDGITAEVCNDGWIHHNTLLNNTDIDIVVGGGNCRVQHNQITHEPDQFGSYGFAGIHVGYFQGGGGNHSGSDWSGNTVSSDQDLLAFGIVYGSHPWDPFLTVSHANVQSNSATGAVVNLAVDGTNGGTVSNNTATGARGTDGWGSCTLAANYTVAHFGSTSLQSGFICRSYHSGTCQDVPCQ